MFSVISIMLAMFVGLPASIAESRQAQLSTTVLITVTPYPSAFGTLSGIAGKVCGSQAKYPQVAQANGIRAPYVIYPGQQLKVPCSSGTIRVTPVAATGTWVSPLAHFRQSSCYGWRFLKQEGHWRFHYGTDLAAPTGTPVRAVHAGTVSGAGWVLGGYGISVVVSHGGGTYSHYGHMSRKVVYKGQRVRAGQVIGYVGNTGYSFGSHLHLSMWQGWRSNINVTKYMRARGVKVGC